MKALRNRVLVTGGAGFLGSALCDSLLSKGSEVICVDNFFTGSRDNIKHLMPNPQFEVIRHDIIFPLHVEVDQIFNMACPASPIHYQHDPIQTLKTSVSGAINVLGLSKRLGARVFQASTSEVYGDPIEHPQAEDYWGNVNPIGFRSCYDEGKRCAETLFFDYHRQHAVDIRIGRIFNTYGPGMHPNDGRVVSNFILQALLDRPITIYGDGSQTRSFCFVDDLIEGIQLLMASDTCGAGPFNLGNDTEFSMLELAQLVIELTNSKSVISRQALPSDDPSKRRPDLTKTKRELGWAPVTALRQGLEKTIPYFDSLLASGIRPELWSPK